MIAAFELLMFLMVLGLSVFAVSSFLLRHSKKNDKLRKNVGTLFFEDKNNNTKEGKN